MTVVGTTDGFVSAVATASGRVALAHWPDEAAEIERLRAQGIPRLLLVPEGERPPIDADLKTDWIRLPVSDIELRARVQVLELRAEAIQGIPVLTGDGRLLYRGRWVVVPPTSEKMIEVMLGRFGAVIPVDELTTVAWPDQADRRGVLRTHMTKLRPIIAPLGLGIRGVRDRGYLLHVLTDAPAGS